MMVQIPGSGMTPRRSQGLLHDLLPGCLQVHVCRAVFPPESGHRCECSGIGLRKFELVGQ